MWLSKRLEMMVYKLTKGPYGILWGQEKWSTFGHIILCNMHFPRTDVQLHRSHNLFGERRDYYGDLEMNQYETV